MMRPSGICFTALAVLLAFSFPRSGAGQTASRAHTLVIGVLSYETDEASAPDSISRNAERGLRLGLEEARETAHLFGRDVKEARTVVRRGEDAAKAARIMARTSNMSALLVTNPELLPAAESVAAVGYAVVVMRTLPAQQARCSRLAFTVYPPQLELDSVKSRFTRGANNPVVAGASTKAIDTVLQAEVWAPSLERFGALELNDRFRARWKTGMTSEAWASWIAVKILSEAFLRKQSNEPLALLEYIRSSEFDGHKGWPLTFRPADHLLRQPLYIVSAARAKTVAELPGGGRSETESAETILDRVLPPHPSASCK